MLQYEWYKVTQNTWKRRWWSEAEEIDERIKEKTTEIESSIVWKLREIMYELYTIYPNATCTPWAIFCFFNLNISYTHHHIFFLSFVFFIWALPHFTRIGMCDVRVWFNTRLDFYALGKFDKIQRKMAEAKIGQTKKKPKIKEMPRKKNVKIIK